MGDRIGHLQKRVAMARSMSAWNLICGCRFYYTPRMRNAHGVGADDD